MIRRVGRPGLIGLAARTAVVAGTASAVSGGVAARQQRRAQAQHEQECAATLARAHAQSPAAQAVVDDVGNGGLIGEALLEWAYAYAELSRAGYDAFVAARG